MDRLLVTFPDPMPALLRVEGDAFHHAVRVLRARVGTQLELFDGQGRAAVATLERVDDGGAEFRMGPLESRGTSRAVTLLQGLPKGERWEWILQKGTELGATTFVPIASARSVVQLSEERASGKHARWEKIAAEAARQSGRADVPIVARLTSLPQALAMLPPQSPFYVLDEEERSQSLKQALAGLPSHSPISVSIGPEGGWTREEVALQCQRGGIPVSLGARVLRTETAALAVLAVLAFLELD